VQFEFPAFVGGISAREEGSGIVWPVGPTIDPICVRPVYGKASTLLVRKKMGNLGESGGRGGVG